MQGHLNKLLALTSRAFFQKRNVSYCQKLKDRSLISISGPDSHSLLQGLITNDVDHLGSYSRPSAMYAMFLCSRGRVLFDVLLYKTANQKFLLECQQSEAEKLIQHLKMYKLRKKADMSLEESHQVWAVFPEQAEASDILSPSFKPLSINQKEFPSKILLAIQDPRLKGLGMRFIVSKESSLPTLIEDFEETKEGFTNHRLLLGVGEGTLDFPCENCFPLESNLDLLNGVSFHKGCYLGQELIARLYHSGVTRKRIMPVKFDSPAEGVAENTLIINEKGKSLGKLRSHTKDKGLALLRFEECFKSKVISIKDTDIVLRTMKPSWWPEEHQ